MPKCRCVLYTDESKETVDLRCHRETTSKTGLCASCQKHRAEDRKSGLYKGRWGTEKARSAGSRNTRKVK